MTQSPNDPADLYFVWLEPAPESLDVPGADLFRLRDGLFLARTWLSRSKLYHAVKDAAEPESLCVGWLADAPKFKGVEPGAATWLDRRVR